MPRKVDVINRTARDEDVKSQRYGDEKKTAEDHVDRQAAIERLITIYGKIMADHHDEESDLK